MLGTIPTVGEELPTTLPNLGHQAEGMSEAFTPLLSVYWDESGKKTMGRLGLDPDDWKVTNPHLQGEIHKQALAFCQSTLQTTSKDLHTALDTLRKELVAGLVEKGDSLRELRKRVQGVFEQMSDWKAAQIAATEASRAVHAAQLTADQESGVVAGVELLLSGDACPLCRKVATEAKRVRLGQSFAVIGHNDHYSQIKHPPIHPHCQCAMIEVLKPEWGGPEEPDWSPTLDQPQKGLSDDYEPPKGKEVPKPEPDRLVVAAKGGEGDEGFTKKERRKADIAIKRAIQFAKAYGVEAAGGQAARDYLEDRYYDPGDPFWSERLKRSIAEFDDETGRIYLNPDAREWIDQRKFVRRKYQERFFSTKDPDHVINHEIGHARHHRRLVDEGLTPTEIKAIWHAADHKAADVEVADRVSTYAAYRPVEFVAEVYAGLRNDVKFDQDVMNLYERYKGPR